jgi:hypothetical protein
MILPHDVIGTSFTNWTARGRQRSIVADAALHGHATEDLVDRLAQRLGSIDHAQHALAQIQAASDEFESSDGGNLAKAPTTRRSGIRRQH